MEDNDIPAIYTTTITIPAEDNQVTGNPDKVVISGKISNVGNSSATALLNRKVSNILCKF